jgi:hypothetical protein
VNVVFFLLGDSPLSEYYVPTFQNTPSVRSIFIVLVKKKNKWDEIARVFIQVEVYLKRSLGQLNREGLGRGRVRIEEQAADTSRSGGP